MASVHASARQYLSTVVRPRATPTRSGSVTRDVCGEAVRRCSTHESALEVGIPAFLTNCVCFKTLGILSSKRSPKFPV